MKIQNNKLTPSDIYEVKSQIEKEITDSITKLVEEYDKILTEVYTEAILSKVIDKEVYQLALEAIRVVETKKFEINIVDDNGKSILTNYIYRVLKTNNGCYKDLPILSDNEVSKLKEMGVDITSGYSSRISIRESFLTEDLRNRINSLIYKITAMTDKRSKASKSINLKEEFKGPMTTKKLYQYNKDIYDHLMNIKQQSLNNIDVSKLTPIEKINLLRFKLGD